MEKIENYLKSIKQSKLIKVEIISVIFSIILGTILHFVYQLSGENSIIAWLVPVNESVWEHLKLIFYPMIIASVIQYFCIIKIANNYIEARIIGIFTAMSFVVIAFFTYTGIIGTNFLIIDILIFMASIILGEYASYKLIKRKNESDTKTKILAIGISIFLLICFIVCTYYTPEVNLFRDFQTGAYGING